MIATTATPPPQLAYESAGEGDPIVLIAGLNGLGHFWDPVAHALARGHRVLTFDHPGVGASDSFGAQRIERIAAELLHLADRLDIARFACIGYSTGGLVAQALALDAPDRISALVLSCTWARPDQRFRDLWVAPPSVEPSGPACLRPARAADGIPFDVVRAHRRSKSVHRVAYQRRRRSSIDRCAHRHAAQLPARRRTRHHHPAHVDHRRARRSDRTLSTTRKIWRRASSTRNSLRWRAGISFLSCAPPNTQPPSSASCTGMHRLSFVLRCELADAAAMLAKQYGSRSRF